MSADRTVDDIDQARGLFDARARSRAHVQAELAVVARGKEILSEPREQEKTAEADARGTAGTKIKRR